MYKQGIISPVPKHGPPDEHKSWRPVVILPAASKVVERILNYQVKQHLKKNKLLSQDQFAYQAGKSIQSAWLDLDSRVSVAMESKRIFGVYLLDMSSAFNLVPESVLVAKMGKLGFSRRAQNLMMS